MSLRARGVWGWLALLLAAALVQPVWATDTVVYYHTDALHSVAVVTNASGQVIERTHYAPYGSVLNRALRDGPGYAGHEEDAATGLVYMQQRYYDPESGRFLSVDPVEVDSNTGSNFNRYWYANNNPYRYTDPDGRFCAPCAGALIGGGLELVVQAFNPQDRAAYAAAGTALAHGDFRGALRDVGPQLAQVGVSAAAGAIGAGIAGKVGHLANAVSQGTNASVAGKVTVGTLIQVGGNAVAGAGIGAAAQVGKNAATGQPLGQGTQTAAKIGLIAGGMGGAAEASLTPSAQRLANGTGAFIGTQGGQVAAPNVAPAAAQRSGAAVNEIVSHAPCTGPDKKGGC